MTHSALVNSALFWFLAVMTLVLVLFIAAVIMAPPAGPVPAHGPPPEPPAPDPSWPDPGPPAWRPHAPAFPAGGLAAPLVRWSRTPPHRLRSHPRPSPPANRRRGCRAPWGSPGWPSPAPP
jgi:hypothetical protein